MAERLSAAEEAAQIKAVHQDTLVVDTIWSLIDAKWFETWCHYTGFNITTGEIEASKGGRPGTIDNSRLCDANGDLKKDITEHLDYNLVHSDVANLLYTWYGGGPRIDRKVIAQGFRNKTKIDLYPYILYTSNILPNGDVDLTNLKSEEMSSKTTLASLRTSFHEDDLKNAAASATGETKGEYDSKSESDSIRFWMEVVEEKTSSSSSSSNGGPILALPYYGASTNGITANPAVKSLDDDDEMEDVPLNGLHVSKAKAEKMEDTLAGITDATGVDTSSTSVEGEPHTTDVDAPPPKKIRKSDNYKLVSNDDYIRPLESFPFTRTSPLLIERRNADGTWPRSSYIKDWREFEIGDVIDCLDTVNKWYESTVRDVKDGKVFIHFNAWASNWDEWIPIDSDRLAAKNTHSVPRTIPTTTSYGGYGGGYGYSGYGQSERGRPVVPGAVGLRNLGNTCFMNSTLQCMAHTPLVMDYFLDDDYLAEINRDNPLGWQGRIAEEYGKLVKEYWSGEYTIVAPTKFKEVLGEFQPRFSGYQQQDSSELLSFLLDGLHEDLNRVRKKPPTSAIESNNRPDAIVAREAWDTYLLRNRSIVVDALQGQLKSKLVCPIETCGKVSITFDPYMFLSVPMPTINDTVQLIHVVFADATKPITIYGPVVSKVARMTELKEALSRLCDIPSRRMILADVWSHRIYKFLDDDICVSEIRANDLIYCYEVPELDNFKSNEYVPVQVLNQRTEDNPHYNPEYTHMRKITAELFGIPRVIVLPKKEPVTGEKIRTFLNDALSACLRAGATPDSYKLVQLENDGRNCYRCPYLNHCTGCEVPSDENIFDLGLENRRDTDIRVAFGAQWMNLDAYDSTRLDQMIRHTTADDHSEANKKHDTVALTDCIQAFTKEEILSENDPWYCSSCKEFRCASKKMDLYSLPNIFIIHLKRFSYTRLWRDKISTFVDFPIEGLDLAPYAMGEKDEGRPALYDLYAVSNHMGGLGGGHYNAYVRNMENGHWYLHDDSRVSEVQESEIKSSSAYVLFYRRREFIKNKPS